MEINWYGHSCFRLADRGKATIITDPYGDLIGYEIPKLKADVVTISHDAPGHNAYENVKGYQRLLTGAGEYEIGGVFIIAAGMHNTEATPPKRNLAYLFDYDGLTIAHLGDLDHVPHQSTLEMLGTVNVALVPIGGGGALNATQAAEVINMLEPNFVIPMHYKTDQSVLDLETVDRFLREMGVSRVREEETFKVTPSNLPEQTQIVVLKCSR